MALMKTTLAAGVAVLLAACASVGQGYSEQLNARQQAYINAAGEPVKEFHYFTLWSWEPLSDSALAVYTKPDEAWLVDMDHNCRNLRFTNHIGLTSMSGTVSAHFDRVLTGPQDPPCIIASIRPVDISKLKDPQQGKPREVEEADRGVQK